MENINLDNLILRRSYEVYFRDRSPVDLEEMCEEFDIENKAFWKIVDHMVYQGLLKAYSAGGNYIITSNGIINAEDNSLAPENLIIMNRQIRTLILEKLARVYEERGSYTGAHIDELSQDLDLDSYKLANNLLVLEDLDYIEERSNTSSMITHLGLEAVKEWKQRSNLIDEFEIVSEMKPQPRGRELQKLLAKVIEKDGWEQEEGVRTSHEEMDVIVHKNREYFLIESKWVKEPIQAGVVRELFGKLGNRTGIQGIIFSMSGFTGGAVDQAEDYTGDRMILFFGSEDINSIICKNELFDELLNEKYQQLITRRKIIYN